MGKTHAAISVTRIFIHFFLTVQFHLSVGFRGSMNVSGNNPTSSGNWPARITACCCSFCVRDMDGCATCLMLGFTCFVTPEHRGGVVANPRR